MHTVSEAVANPFTKHLSFALPALILSHSPKRPKSSPRNPPMIIAAVFIIVPGPGNIFPLSSAFSLEYYNLDRLICQDFITQKPLDCICLMVYNKNRDFSDPLHL